MSKDTRIVYVGKQNYQIEELTKTIIQMAEIWGGFSKMFPYGSTVLLKPNLVLRASRERNALTDPVLIDAVLSILKNCGVKASLGDSPAFESAETVANSIGIKAVCDHYQVPIINFKKNAFSDNDDIKKWKIFHQINDFDAVLNLPKLKGHAQLYYTGGVKNLFGCVAGKTKFMHHMAIGDKNFNFGRMLLEVADLVNPTLTIMDGIGAQAGNGPLHGEPVHLGLLAMSKSPIALDFSVCKLLEGELEKMDIYRASKQDGKWAYSREFEEIWLSDKEIGKGFYFPTNRQPIRFSVSHAVKSVFKTLKRRVFS